MLAFFVNENRVKLAGGDAEVYGSAYKDVITPFSAAIPHQRRATHMSTLLQKAFSRGETVCYVFVKKNKEKAWSCVGKGDIEGGAGDVARISIKERVTPRLSAPRPYSPGKCVRKMDALYAAGIRVKRGSLMQCCVLCEIDV